jgi:GTPase SAR1 family protein
MERLDTIVIETLIVDDLELIATQFQKTFTECIENVTKPNVLVSGVTGAGKSSLVNSTFGRGLVQAEVGGGQPITQHFIRYAPKDMPVTIYDSKGLEQGFAQEFIEDAKTFFERLRTSPELGEHIHIIWYVINAAAARFEPFEAYLVGQVFASVPVLLLLNKCDMASSDQIKEMKQTLESYSFPNCKGIYLVVADRKNYNQSWCPACLSDDVSYRKSTNQLFCDECGFDGGVGPSFGLEQVVDVTAKFLPDLAREAFLSAQQASAKVKDDHAKAVVKQYANTISVDLSGKAFKAVGEMVAKIFIIWGWNFLGKKVSSAVEEEMSAEYKNQELSSRLAMLAADTLFKRKLSRSVIACLGVMVNRPLRRLSGQLLSVIEQKEEVKFEDLKLMEKENESFPDEFTKHAFAHGIDKAIDTYWDNP